MRNKRVRQLRLLSGYSHGEPKSFFANGKTITNPQFSQFKALKRATARKQFRVSITQAKAK